MKKAFDLKLKKKERKNTVKNKRAVLSELHSFNQRSEIELQNRFMIPIPRIFYVLILHPVFLVLIRLLILEKK